MLFFELFVPRGLLDEARRRQISARLLAEVVDAGADAPARAHETAAAMRALSSVVVHEVDGAAARFFVRVTVTAGALSEAKRKHVVEAVTCAVAESEPDPDRLFREPDAWVHLVEVPEGSCGALGKPLTFGEIVGVIEDKRIEEGAGDEQRAP
jgi:hypothetical protein